jgi:hypothetical protein
MHTFEHGTRDSKIYKYRQVAVSEYGICIEATTHLGIPSTTSLYGNRRYTSYELFWEEAWPVKSHAR